MIPGSKACVAGLCQPQWQRDERSCSIESWGSGELHSQNEPVGAAAPKSTTGTQLVGDTSPWTAVSALLLLLGSSSCCLIQSSPAFPCEIQEAVCLFPCLVLTSSTQGFVTPDANAQFYLLFPFLPALV